MAEFKNLKTGEIVKTYRYKLRKRGDIQYVESVDLGIDLIDEDGVPYEDMNEGNYDFSSISINTFNAKSKEDKRSEFIKRSHKDYVKNIEPQKRELQGNAINQIKSIVNGKR